MPQRGLSVVQPARQAVLPMPPVMLPGPLDVVSAMQPLLQRVLQAM